MSEVLTIEQVAAEYPWSKSTLYRIAPDEDSPFHKVGGRWVAAREDILEWVRSGPKPTARRAEIDPMPRRRRGSVDNFLEEVHPELRRAA